MIHSFKYHRREIEKLCQTKSKDPSYKFNKLIRHFYRKDPGFSTYKKSIIDFFMKNFNRMNQHDFISILWLLCHLHSSKFISLPTNKNIKHKHDSNKNNNYYNNRPLTHLRGVTRSPYKYHKSPIHTKENKTISPLNKYTYLNMI